MLDHTTSSQNEEHAKSDLWNICENPERPKATVKVLIYQHVTKEPSVLHFSSGGKVPFLTGKAKNMHQRSTLLAGGGGVFRIHEGFYFRAPCQPIDGKVFYTPQNKEFYKNEVCLGR